MTRCPNLGFEEGDEPIKIAKISFAFDNSQVIKWLRTRGTHIKNENWKGVT